MSSLKVNQIRSKLLAMFEAALDLTDIGQHDAEREIKILSRCLAAFAIYEKTGCDIQEAADSVWDGGDDNGIDAAYYDPANSSVFLVQSKWIKKGSGEPESKDIGAFVKGVKDTIEQEIDNFHQRLHGRFQEIMKKLSSPGTSVGLLVITTGASNLAKHSSRILNGLLEELNGNDVEPIAFVDVLGMAEVYSKLANDGQQNGAVLEATVLDWSYISSPFHAYFGVIDGLQLKQWWKKHGRRLLAGNIRYALGATEVNNQIKQTAMFSPEKFWYFNNGITLVCDEATKAPVGAASRAAGIFCLNGSSIVNGAQTVSSLGTIEDDVRLGNVRVPIRIIILKSAPSGFGAEVARANNLQNRIELRDFAAQDPEQRRLHSEMAMEGIDYQFLRSDEANSTVASCELIEVATALACASGDPNLAVQIKTGVGRLFMDLTKSPYKAIFNPVTSGALAFNSVRVQREIDKWIDSEKVKMDKKNGTGWGVLVHGNRILATCIFRLYGTAKLSCTIGEFAKEPRTDDLGKIAAGVYKRMVNSINTHYSGKVLAVLFKNPTKSKHIFDLATTVAPDGSAAE